MVSRRERIASGMNRLHLHGVVRRYQPWHGLVVLNYHRLGNPQESLLDRGTFSGTGERFAEQIDLLRQSADLVDPADIPAVLAPDAPRGRYVALTFDDGYRDNFELALPALVATGVKATFFLATGFLDRPRLPWNDEVSWMLRTSERRELPVTRWLPHAYSLAPEQIDATVTSVHQLYIGLTAAPERAAAFLADLATVTGSGRAPAEASAELWMTWDMVRQMQAAGMELGAHTVNHPVLAELTTAAQEAEISGSRDRITAETGIAPRAFSYPYGGRHQFSAITQRLVEEHGFSHAYSFYGGYNLPGKTDRYNVQRVYVSQHTSNVALEGLVSLPQLYGYAPPRRLPRPQRRELVEQE